VSSTVRLVATGQALIERLPSGPALDGMLRLDSVLSQADIVLCNLEVSLQTGVASWPTKEAVLHSAPVAVLDLLRRIGITTLSLANNHFGDLGPVALGHAIAEVEARGFFHAGAGSTVAAASAAGGSGGFALLAVSAGPAPIPGRALDPRGGEPGRAGVNGLAIRRTVVADPHSFAQLRQLLDATGQSGRIDREVANGRRAPLPDDALDFYGTRVELGDRAEERAEVDRGDRSRLLENVATAAALGTPAFVSIHYHDWEPDWAVPPAWLSQLSHDCVDAGALAIIAHGPPVTGPIEVYRGGLIAYGVGNLVFHTRRTEGYRRPEVWGGYLLDLIFDERRSLSSARLHPVQLDRSDDGEAGFPRLATPIEADQILARATALSAPYGVTIRALSDGTGELSWS
jgi:poly-gamma-glutamate capsule biosynthesis protein CapA/YwtB (metallophosphatase superfamily)